MARGLESERQAFRFLKNQGYTFVAHRYRTPFAEVDLILRRQGGGLCLVEVKSIKSWDRLNTRLSLRQKQRLRRAQAWFSEQQEDCLLLLVVVGQDGEVLVFDDVFSSN